MIDIKKILILTVLVKSSLAISLFPFHDHTNKINSQSPQNLNLYKLLNTNNCSNDTTHKIKPATDSCYNITSLINSYSNFTLKQNDEFLTKKFPITQNILQCNYQTREPDKKAILSAKMALAVVDSDRKYKVFITDPYGENPQAVVISNAPITSVSWSKSGNSIAYVSYEAGKPIIYIQNIYTAKRYVVANFDGSNSSPAFMDNNSLLVSLSKDYGTHIYKIDLSNYTSRKTAIPVIASDSIDTEANYSNGNLIFTSSNNDKPQIYLKSNNLTKAKQISIGRNNTTGRISGDGSKVLYIHGISSNKYDLMYYDIKTGISKKIDSGKILSASFASDNSLIAYIKNNQIIIRNLNYNNAIPIANLKYREIFDIKWSK